MLVRFRSKAMDVHFCTDGMRNVDIDLHRLLLRDFIAHGVLHFGDRHASLTQKAE